MPKVTAITSVYQSERYLQGYLKNITKQKFKDFEIVMEINNASYLELKYLRKFRKKNNLIKLLVSSELNSMSKSWNNCINNSNSEYICIWNVDDQRTPISIESMANTLDKNKDIDIVYGHYHKVKKFKSKRGNLVDVSNQEHLLKIGMLLGPFFMFRREILKSSGLFDEQLLSGADYDFALRILNFGNSKYIKENLGYFLDEGMGASTKPNSKQEIERTVIELRHNIRILNKSLVNDAKSLYDISSIYFNESKHSIKKFIPND
jgi:glycosyltransferase involved in cell wall biosynthesis